MKIKDSLETVGVEDASRTYPLYVKNAVMTRSSIEIVDDNNEEDPEDEDAPLIADSVDYSFETDMDAAEETLD